MKRRSFVYAIVTVLLLMVTLFSVAATFTSHQETCEHTTCETCVETVMAQENIVELLQTQSLCEETACETCVLLQEQLVVLQEQETHHACHEQACDFCLRASIGKSLRTIVVLLSSFALLYAVCSVIKIITHEQKYTISTFSLLSLKVRLNN